PVFEVVEVHRPESVSHPPPGRGRAIGTRPQDPGGRAESRVVGSGKGAAPIDATVGVAGLFFAGSLVCLPTLVLQPWPEVWLPGVAFNCVSAAVLSVALYVFRERVGP